MKPVTPLKEVHAAFPDEVPEDISEREQALFFDVISTDLTEAQKERIVEPAKTYPRQRSVLAVHWHPEFVPMDLNRQRIETMFPGRENELVIPTQHNEILSYGPYSGVEVDCYAAGFRQKVQLLLHFENSRVEQAGVLRAMLAHTFQYRSSQLFSLMRALTGEAEGYQEKGAAEIGAAASLVGFVSAHVDKIRRMLEEHYDDVPPASIKNKLIRNYFDGMRDELGDLAVNRVQAYVRAIKVLVKQNFSLKHFYRAREVIEEARALGGCVVIPHPEQFWPVLLAGYDVDGYEVWNPQSRRYTDFLIQTVIGQNRQRSVTERDILIFMGDDCHMGEKTKEPAHQNPEKASREIGVQPPWDDLGIRKALIVAGINRETVIREYKSRLSA